MSENNPPSRRSIQTLVPILGLVYGGLFILFVSFFESPPISAANPYPLIADSFAVIFFVAAFLIRRGGRIGYLIAIPVCSLFTLIFSSDLQSALTGFADYPTFLQSIITTPVLLLIIISSLLGLRNRPKTSGQQGKLKSIPTSALAVIFVAGFVVGGAFIGGLASGVESRLLANYGTGANVTIVFGATNNYNGGLTYSPANYTVKVGSIVTWVNKDTSIHTVTSQGTTLFDSGDLPTGATFSFTFTQPGTYHYFCTYHSFMVGTIVVTT